MLSKIISLLIAMSYLVALILIIWLAVSLGCIWWGEELGEGLIGAKYGLVSASSPGWAVKLIGWLLLLVPAVIACYVRMQGGNRAGG